MGTREELPPVILVEDSVDDVYFTKRLLSRGGVKNPVIVFADGKAAIAYLNRVAHGEAPRPAAIICDVFLPGIRGPQIITTLRANAACHGIPIVVLSGPDDEAARQESLRCGANAYFQKFPSARELASFIAA